MAIAANTPKVLTGMIDVILVDIKDTIVVRLVTNIALEDFLKA